MNYLVETLVAGRPLTDPRAEEFLNDGSGVRVHNFMTGDSPEDVANKVFSISTVEHCAIFELGEPAVFDRNGEPSRSLEEAYAVWVNSHSTRRSE